MVLGNAEVVGVTAKWSRAMCISRISRKMIGGNNEMVLENGGMVGIVSAMVWTAVKEMIGN